MLMTRSNLTQVAFDFISKGTTISVRYSLVRHQFKNNEGKKTPIVDYQTQQEKVIPRRAESYAALFTYQSIQKLGADVFA
jgi:acyl-CoA oxidase